MKSSVDAKLAARRGIGTALLPALVALSLALPLVVALAPRKDAPVWVLGPSQAAVATSIALADGFILDGAKVGLVARFPTDDAFLRLAASGAWLALDASGHATCISNRRSRTRSGDPHDDVSRRR
jgi:hypothetical protein